MQFIDSLPAGLENVDWQVLAPQGGVSEALSKVVSGESLTITLAIKRDSLRALVLVAPDVVEGVTPDSRRAPVFHLFRSVVIFLDLDGQMTDSVYVGNIVLNTEVQQEDMSAGHVIMWQEAMNFMADAS